MRKHYRRIASVEMASKNEVYAVHLEPCLGAEEEPETKGRAIEESEYALLTGWGARGKLWSAPDRVRRAISKVLKPCDCGRASTCY